MAEMQVYVRLYRVYLINGFKDRSLEREEY